MSRAARIDSFQAHRVRSSAIPALGIFALGLAIGIVVGVAVWQSQNPSSNMPASRADPSRTAAARPARAAPQLGRYPVDVLRVIDGDTFEARVHVWPGQELTTRVRLRGIDAPELKARCDGERVKAEAALVALRTLLTDQDVSIWSVGPDKYFGRVVAEVGTRRTPDISADLLAKGVARSYAGGHRDGWCDTAMGR